MTSFSQQFVLTIVNTKAAAREIYSEAPCVLLDAGYAPTVIDTTMSDVQIRALAQTQLDVIVELLNDRPRKCLGWEKTSRGLCCTCLTFFLFRRKQRHSARYISNTHRLANHMKCGSPNGS